MDSIPTGTYQKLIKLFQGPTLFGASAPMPDHGLLLVGSTKDWFNSLQEDYAREACLVKLDSVGRVEFAKGLGFDAPVYPNQYTSVDVNEYFGHVLVLPDSGFIAAGPERYNGPLEINAPFLCRFDKHGNLLWSRDLILYEYTHTPYNWLDQMALMPNGNLLLVGMVSNASSSFVVEADINSGAVLKSRVVRHPGYEYNYLHSDPVFYNGKIYLQGLVQELLPFFEPAKSILVCFDENLDIDFVKSYTVDTNSVNAYFNAGWSLSLTPDGFILGNELRIPDCCAYKYMAATLMKTDFEGNLLWAKSYHDDTPSSNGGLTNMIDQVHVDEGSGDLWVNFADMYSTVGLPYNYGAPYQTLSIGRLDGQGNLMEHRFIKGFYTNLDSLMQFDMTQVHFLADGRMLMAGFGRVNHFAGFYAMTSDVDSFTPCSQDTMTIHVEDLPVVQEDFSMASDTPTFAFYFEDFDMPIWEGEVLTRDICCDSVPDWDIWNIFPADGYSCADSIKVWMGICNTNDDTPSSADPTSPDVLSFDSLLVFVYDKDPFSTATQPVYQFYVHADQSNWYGWHCRAFYVTLPLSGTGPYYFLLNPPTSINAPFNPFCDFQGHALPECDYHNNLYKFKLPESQFIHMELGPDTILCPGASVQLAAGEHFSSFLWQDGSTDSLYTIQTAGLYWLEAVDKCGITHRDSMTVGFDDVPAFDFGMDTIRACAGDTVQLSMPQIYNSYKWWKDTGGFFAFTCDTCAQTAAAFIDFPYIVNGIGFTSHGCTFRDTLAMIPYPRHTWPVPKVDTFACINTGIQLGGDYFPIDTTVIVTLQTSHGCDSLVKYVIHPRDTFYHILDLSACEGDTLLFGGQAVAAGQELKVLYASQQGCDSTVLYRVAALPVFEATSDTTICPGTTVNLFGNEEETPGSYTGHFTATNGCDSVQVITLSWHELPTVSISTTPACAGLAEGTATANLGSGSPPFTLEWGNGHEMDTLATALLPGSYTVTITDANGCVLVVPYTIETWPSNIAYQHCEPQVYAPTAFSPNGDGQNDHFTLYGNERAVEILSLQVYDRWGELVFEARDIPLNEEAKGWDGTLDGEALNPAVFPWKAVVRHSDGSTELMNGDLMLMR